MSEAREKKGSDKPKAKNQLKMETGNMLRRQQPDQRADNSRRPCVFNADRKSLAQWWCSPDLKINVCTSLVKTDDILNSQFIAVTLTI